jgi:hypothetical protein
MVNFLAGRRAIMKRRQTAPVASAYAITSLGTDSSSSSTDSFTTTAQIDINDIILHATSIGSSRLITDLSVGTLVYGNFSLLGNFFVGTNRMELYAARATATINSGSTFSRTFNSATAHVALAAKVSGISTGTILRTAETGATATSQSVDSTTGALTAEEIAIALCLVLNGESVSLTPDSSPSYSSVASSTRASYGRLSLFAHEVTSGETSGYTTNHAISGGADKQWGVRNYFLNRNYV